MKLLDFYQTTLGHSVELYLDSGVQIEENLKQLGNIKAKYIASKIMGKEYSRNALIDSHKTWHGTYEDVPYKLLYINVSVRNYSVKDAIVGNGSLVTISLQFVRDPNVVLNSKLKLTDAEKKLLREIKECIHTLKGELPHYSYYDRLTKLNNNLSDLKHNIGMVINLSWDYNLERLLDSNFLTNGMRAEESLL